MKNIFSRVLAAVGGKKPPEEVAAKYLSEQLAQDIRSDVCAVILDHNHLRVMRLEFYKQMGNERRTIAKIVGCRVPGHKDEIIGGSGLTYVGLTEDGEPVGFL